MLKGFRDFIMRGNVLDLAVAVVIGTAFTALVNSFVKDILTPLIAALVGKPDFSTLTFTINGSRFTYGSFINALISFLLVATAIYFFVIVPVKKLDEMRRRRFAAGQEPEEVALPSEEIVALHEIRDLLAAQQGDRPSSS
jgi:large conductance mechanosensitive channel